MGRDLRYAWGHVVEKKTENIISHTSGVEMPKKRVVVFDAGSLHMFPAHAGGRPEQSVPDEITHRKRSGDNNRVLYRDAYVRDTEFASQS